jgi:hypothetical protein
MSKEFYITLQGAKIVVTEKDCFCQGESVAKIKIKV